MTATCARKQPLKSRTLPCIAHHHSRSKIGCARKKSHKWLPTNAAFTPGKHDGSNKCHKSLLPSSSSHLCVCPCPRGGVVPHGATALPIQWAHLRISSAGCNAVTTWRAPDIPLTYCTVTITRWAASREFFLLPVNRHYCWCQVEPGTKIGAVEQKKGDSDRNYFPILLDEYQQAPPRACHPVKVRSKRSKNIAANFENCCYQEHLGGGCARLFSRLDTSVKNMFRESSLRSLPFWPWHTTIPRLLK